MENTMELREYKSTLEDAVIGGFFALSGIAMLAGGIACTIKAVNSFSENDFNTIFYATPAPSLLVSGYILTLSSIKYSINSLKKIINE